MFGKGLRQAKILTESKRSHEIFHEGGEEKACNMQHCSGPQRFTVCVPRL